MSGGAVTEHKCECGRTIEVVVDFGDDKNADKLVALLRRSIRNRGGNVQAALGTSPREVPPAYVRD